MPCRDSRGCKRFLGRALGRPRGGCPWRGEPGVGQSEQGDAGKRAPASTPQLADVAKPCARPTLHRFPVPLAPAPRLLAAQDYLSSPNPRAPGLRLLRSASSHRQSQSNRPLRSRTPVLPPRSLAPAAIAISLLGAAPAAGSSLGDRRQTLLAQRLVAPHTSQPLQERTAPGPHHPRTILPGVPALTCTLRRRGHRLALWCAAPGFVRRPGRRQSPLLRSPRNAQQTVPVPAAGDRGGDGRSWKDSGTGARAAYWPPCAGVPPCAALRGSKALRPRGQFPVLCPELLRAPPVE